MDLAVGKRFFLIEENSSLLQALITSSDIPTLSVSFPLCVSRLSICSSPSLFKFPFLYIFLTTPFLLSVLFFSIRAREDLYCFSSSSCFVFHSVRLVLFVDPLIIALSHSLLLFLSSSTFLSLHPLLIL